MLRVSETINYASTEVRRPLKSEKYSVSSVPVRLSEVSTEVAFEFAYLWLH